MNFIDIIKTSSVNLWRNKGRTFLTVIAIFIGAFTIALTTSVNSGVNSYIKKQLAVFGNSRAITINKKKDSGRSLVAGGITEFEEGQGANENGFKLLTPEDLERLRKMPEIESDSIEPTISSTLDYIQIGDSKKFKAGVLNFGKDFAPDVRTGRLPQNAREAMLTQDYIEAFDISDKDLIGKTLKIRISDQITKENKILEVKIVGILNKNMIQSSSVLMDFNLAKEIFDFNQKSMPEVQRTQFFGAYGYFKDEKFTSDDVKFEEIKAEFDKRGFTIARLQDRIQSVMDITNGVTGALIVFGGIALLAASFGIINTLYMSVRERTREIGLMKAMGLSNGKIFTLFSVEAMLIGLLGSVLGIWAAIGVGGAINNFASNSFLKGLEGLSLTQFTPENSIRITLVVMFIAFIAGSLPARAASKKDPIEALRYE